jgi:hypothetical protein
VTGLARERLRPPVSETPPMANAQPKIVLSQSQDIPFNKLVLSQANVSRRWSFSPLARARGSACRRGYGVLRTGKVAPYLRFVKKGSRRAVED